MSEFKYTSNNFPWNNSLSKSYKWRIKLAPNDEIIKSLEDFVLEQTNANNNVVVGFAEFRMLGSVWADSIQYAISEEFGNVKPIAPYGYDFVDDKKLFAFSNLKANGDFKTKEQQIAADKIYKKEPLNEEDKKNRKKLEVLFCYGTISWEQSDKSKKTNPYDKPKAHAHVMLAESNKKGNAFGGHLLKAKVSIVAEIILDVITTEKARLGTENWDEKQNFNL